MNQVPTHLEALAPKIKNLSLLKFGLQTIPASCAERFNWEERKEEKIQKPPLADQIKKIGIVDTSPFNGDSDMAESC